MSPPRGSSTATSPPPPEAGALADLPLEPHVPLRLTVARGVLGMELYESVELRPLTVGALSLSLPNLRFPLDLSGGVPAFRHRRGVLEHVRLEVGLGELARWLEPRLGESLGPLDRPPSVWARPGSLSVGLTGERGALAFDVLWAPLHGDARLVVANARGMGLGAPALGYALRALDSVFGTMAERQGRLIYIEGVGARLGRHVLPAIGARAPAASEVRFGGLKLDDDQVSVELDRTFAPPAVTEQAARALELGNLVPEADDALARGDLDAARAGYLSALERAPRHPELSRLVAEIDASVSGRSEAALGLLVEAMQASHAGEVGALLLAGVGDLDGAREALERAARDEPYAPLAALAWARLSELEPERPAKLGALDQAVARAPALGRVRWQRLGARLERGDVEGALADAEHLEAAECGARARHDTCRAAARRFLDAGFVRDAGKLFERALRYVPDDASATAGLGRALMEAGRADRAVGLFERAITLSEKRGQPDPDALVDLARLLAEELGDLPQAVARVRQVPAGSPRVVEARGLEARWRWRLGDLSGASLAYARVREAIELSAQRDATWVEWLDEAARFERDVLTDPVAAERHLAVALRLAPRDPRIAEAYREVAAVVALRIRRDRSAGDGD